LLLIGPRLTLLFQTLSPPFAALISGLFLHEHLVRKDWVAMGLTLTGVIWVVLERANGRQTHRARKGDVPVLPESPEGCCAQDRSVPFSGEREALGILLAVLAALGQAGGLVLSRRGIGQYDAAAATFIRVLPAMAGFLLLLTVVRAWPSVASAVHDGRAMLILALGAMVGPFLGVILSMVAVRHCHAGVAATILCTMPVLILPLVILVYGERVSLRAAVGAMISVAGVALLMLPRGGTP
jgi:drug/metabolite transporter (DMT)-like permease